MRRALALAALALPSAALAVPWGASPVTLTFGRDVRVERASAPCPFSALGRGENAGCFEWRAEGLRLPPPSATQRVHMLAPAARGRVVAVVEGGALFTDDRGARWQTAAWEGPQQPRSVAFDPRGEEGWAVGTAGTVWASRDRGATWRVRRDGLRGTLVDVAVGQGVVAVVGDQRGVWVSTDGGARFTTLVEQADAAPSLTVSGRAVVIRAGDRTWRATAASGVEPQ